jgi:short-subunit dehydrogenase
MRAVVCADATWLYPQAISNPTVAVDQVVSLAPAPKPDGLKPITLITGASAGIGAAFARLFAGHGHECALVARRTARLAALAEEIAAAGHTRPHVIALDLTEREAPARLAQDLAARGLEPAIVVNNAGFGLRGPAADLDHADELAMIDLNVHALTALSLMFVDSLKRHGGGLINVASLSGFFPGPGMAVYFAGKAYVLSLSEALARELASQGVRVTCICPGPVPTEFQARAGLYENPAPFLCRSAEQIARDAHDAFMSGRPLIVPGIANKIAAALPRFLPRAVVLRAVEAFQKRAGPNAQAKRSG